MLHHEEMRTAGKVIEYAHVWELLEEPVCHAYAYWVLWSDRFHRFVTVKDQAIAITGDTDGISFADADSAMAFACANLHAASVVPVQLEVLTHRITAYSSPKIHPITLQRLAGNTAHWVADPADDFMRFGTAAHAVACARFLAQAGNMQHVLHSNTDTTENIFPGAYDTSSSHWRPVFRRLRKTAIANNAHPATRSRKITLAQGGA